MLGPILAWGPKGGSAVWAVRLPLPAPPPPPQPSTDPLPRKALMFPAMVGEGMWVSRTHRPDSAVGWKWMRVPHSASEKGESGGGVGGGR